MGIEKNFVGIRAGLEGILEGIRADLDVGKEIYQLYVEKREERYAPIREYFAGFDGKDVLRLLGGDYKAIAKRHGERTADLLLHHPDLLLLPAAVYHRDIVFLWEAIRDYRNTFEQMPKTARYMPLGLNFS